MVVERFDVTSMLRHSYLLRVGLFALQHEKAEHHKDEIRGGVYYWMQFTKARF